MQNQGCSGGCLSFIAGLVIIGLTLLAIKWFGIPAGLGLTVLGYVQFQRSEKDVEGFERTSERLGIQSEYLRWITIGLMVVGVMLMIASIILWSVPTDEAKTASVSAPATDTASGPVPVAYRGSWAFDGKCADINAGVVVSHDDVMFSGGGLFAVDRANGSDSRIVLSGRTIHSPSWRDTTVQSDAMTLALSDGGQTMVMDSGRSNGENEHRLTRCAG